MSDADRRAFVNDPKRAQVTDARATGTSKAPFTQEAAPQDPLADPRRDEDDYDNDVQRIRPITWDMKGIMFSRPIAKPTRMPIGTPQAVSATA